jgi:hypothetical protein
MQKSSISFPPEWMNVNTSVGPTRASPRPTSPIAVATADIAVAKSSPVADPLTLDGDQPASDVHGQVAGLRCGWRRHHHRPPQQRPDSGQQLARRERLDEVVVGALVQGGDLVAVG